MRKIFLLTLFTFFFFAFGIKEVSALNSKRLFSGEIQYLEDDIDYEGTCNSLFGDPEDPNKESVAYFIQLGLNIIKYVGIIACILLTITDFAKAIFGDDKEMLKSLTKKAITRIMYAVALFLLPYIVNFLLTLIGVYDTCGIQ